MSNMALNLAILNVYPVDKMLIFTQRCVGSAAAFYKYSGSEIMYANDVSLR